jgi:hypothetical protein
MLTVTTRWAFAAATIAMLTTSSAHAVSARVKLACAKDYYAHCSMHKPDTPGVRSCMRSVGLKLSQRCFKALQVAGEVSDKDAATRSASMGH